MLSSPCSDTCIVNLVLSPSSSIDISTTKWNACSVLMALIGISSRKMICWDMRFLDLWEESQSLVLQCFLERIHLALSYKLWNECVTAFIFQKYFMIGKGDWSADLAKQIWYEIHMHLASFDNQKGALCTKMPWPSSCTEKLDWEEE